MKKTLNKNISMLDRTRDSKQDSGLVIFLIARTIKY